MNSAGSAISIPDRKQLAPPIFGWAVSQAAFLLFALEPLAGKIATPLFGGTAAVWSVLLLFFQVALLIGYAFTYSLSKLSHLKQSLLYIACAIVTTVVMCATAKLPWLTPDPAAPELTLLTSLCTHFAPSVIFLATVSGVMQVWFKRLTDHNPYPLYSLSNFGSLAALVAYPFLIEPMLSIAASMYWWRVGMIMVCVVTCLCALISATAEVQPEAPEFRTEPIKTRECVWWIILSAVPSALLVSMSAFVTQDVAPVPLLWIPPLAVYLISFIVAFSGKVDGRIKLVSPLVTLLCIAVYPAVDFGAVKLPILTLLPLCLLFLFSACMTCQDELYKTKPEPTNLPVFYVMLALGGALGGLAASIIAPLAINEYLEHCLIIAAVFGIVQKIISGKDFAFLRANAISSTAVTIAMVIACCAIVSGVVGQYNGFYGDNVIHTARNFYGTVRVLDKQDRLEVYHGTILHGLQYKEPERRLEPAAYYANIMALVDRTMRSASPTPRSINFGIIGLGVGTMSAWTQPGDSITFYELDPKIDHLAKAHFTFLSSSKAPPNIVLGDARASLRREAPNHYDLLMIDAFNGDSIPMHLLTREALQLYKGHTTTDGVILFHVSNHFLELVPVLANAAAKEGLKAYEIHEGTCRYVLMTSNDRFVSTMRKLHAANVNSKVVIEPARPNVSYPVWTDDYSNILSVLRFRT